MTPERTINILGKDVRLRYCAATENGFEQLRSKSIYDIDFKSNEDLIALSMAAVIAAYARNDENPPVSGDDLLYDAKPSEIVELIKTVMELRSEWYEVPSVVPAEQNPTDDDEEERPKN